MSLVRAKAFFLAVAAATLAVGIAPGDAQTSRPSSRVKCETPALQRCPDMHYRFEHLARVDSFVVPPTTDQIRITAVGAPAGTRPTVSAWPSLTLGDLVPPRRDGSSAEHSLGVVG